MSAPLPARPVSAEPPRYRENPFLPDQSDVERRDAEAEEARRREMQEMLPQLRQELIPEIRDMLRQEIQAAKDAAPPPAQDAALQGDVKATGDAAASGLGAPLDPKAGADDGKAAAEADGKDDKDEKLTAQAGRPQKVEEAKFRACMNGKAVYRDSSGVSFVNDHDETSCSGV